MTDYTNPDLIDLSKYGYVEGHPPKTGVGEAFSAGYDLGFERGQKRATMKNRK